MAEVSGGREAEETEEAEEAEDSFRVPSVSVLRPGLKVKYFSIIV